MSSSSRTSDQTNSATQTTVIDRKAIQERGQQILDSLIVANDDKVVKAAVGEAATMLVNMGGQNAVTVAKLLETIETISSMVNKGQADISAFGLSALEKARSELRAINDRGEVMLTLANQTTNAAMDMAQKVAADQAKAQATALEIIAETRTADYADNLKTLSGMVMGFTLLALLILRRKA